MRGHTGVMLRSADEQRRRMDDNCRGCGLSPRACASTGFAVTSRAMRKQVLKFDTTGKHISADSIWPGY
jgi:hypothetical protein